MDRIATFSPCLAFLPACWQQQYSLGGLQREHSNTSFTAKGEEMTDTPRRAGPWTPEEDGLLRSMAAAGESVAAIMKPLKRSKASIRNRARILKIKFARVPLGRRPKAKK